jgi:Protein of unknown function (DUF1572)
LDYLESANQEFRRYKGLAEKAIAQISDDELHWQLDPESNSIAVIMKHISGNQLSRWTDFLVADGEKLTRNRDAEFHDDIKTREQLLEVWDEGWKCLFAATATLTEDDLVKTVTIRGEEHSVVQAINRQIGHYANHVGQIVYIAKHLRSADWKTLSIPKGQSANYRPH